MAATDQINRGSQMQAAATEQTSAALAQIQKSAGVAQTNATLADQRVGNMDTALKQSEMRWRLW